MTSINYPGEGRCVDIFIRSDGSFGFDEFRRDAEDGRGWFPVGFHSDRVYASEEEALLEARSSVPWLNDVIDAGTVAD